MSEFFQSPASSDVGRFIYDQFFLLLKQDTCLL